MGNKMFMETDHDLAGAWAEQHPLAGNGDKKLKAEADYQAILSVILESVREVMSNKFRWDLRYKNTTYVDLMMEPVFLFMRCDNKEGDKICGSFGVRTRNVRSICRQCLTDTQLTSCCVNTLQPKTAHSIKGLINRKEVARLKEMAQHCVPLAFHEGIPMGLHDRAGIHGACPMDILHSVLFGWLKTNRTCWFDQIGDSSAAAKEIEVLSTLIGQLSARQSARDMPRMKFSKGLRSGKLTANEMIGVGLLQVLCMSTAKGRHILQKQRGSHFKKDSVYRDWIELLDDTLQYVAFLQNEQFQVSDLRRLDRKIGELMYFAKQVWQRKTGMGCKLGKFHYNRHIPKNSLNLGPPNVQDTKFNESHFKPSKKLSALTQKHADVFESQTQTRHVEMEMLDLAMLEIHQGMKKWDYKKRVSPIDEDAAEKDTVSPVIRNGGSVIQVAADAFSGEPYICFPGSRMRNHVIRWEWDILRYLSYLQDRYAPYLRGRFLPIFTEHVRDKQIFRGHPRYRDNRAWNDWVLVDYGGEPVPSLIWCFVDLQCLPAGTSFNQDGISVDKGIYAVVESTSWQPEVDEEHPDYQMKSSLVRSCVKDAKTWEPNDPTKIKERQFYLANVEAFVSPIMVIPDVGSDHKSKYLAIKARQEWSDMFVEWLKEDVNEDLLEDEWEALRRYEDGEDDKFDDYYVRPERREDSSDTDMDDGQDAEEGSDSDEVAEDSDEEEHNVVSDEEE